MKSEDTFMLGGCVYSTSKIWSFGPGQISMALPVQVRALLEYWNTGVLEKAKALIQLE
jgi:hypothetical protein